MTFAARHIGATGTDRDLMLKTVGAANLTDLLRRAVPASIYEDSFPDGLPAPAEQHEVLERLREIAAHNTVRTSLIGQGYYDTVTPAVIQRGVLESPSWYTAYTPYQPEISQGRLEALLNFQTMVGDLTGLEVAGASMLDEATAAAEAMLLARRVAKRGSVFYVDRDVFVATRAVLATRAAALEIELRDFDAATTCEFPDAFGVLIQQPGASGRVLPDAHLRRMIEQAHSGGALVALAADLLALTLIASPGELGADIAVGSTQRFGVPMGFGGPSAGYLSVHTRYVRQLPGRLVGVSRDADGARAYRLALQTREQHIRREKATSNICTAQVLLAVMASMYAVWHGPDGLRAIAKRVHGLTADLAARVAGVENDSAFDTLTIAVADADLALENLRQEGVLAWPQDRQHIRISLDETTTPEVCDVVVRVLGSGQGPDLTELPSVRTTQYLTHPVFHQYRSETAMMRYLKRLEDKDYALDRGMIPLGSCTMKLNSAIEMGAITWPEFARIHPYAPAADVAGYRILLTELSDWLLQLTGYDAVSLQPNAGSQGELSGLLAIRGYHASRHDQQRRICLIPSSAHGTNAASAVLAGMEVVVVACDEHGDVDVADLRAKASEYSATLAALMVTYPSTHGVYEERIGEICEIVHEHGGQVYIDGANLNALVGVARPGSFGGDVSHLNLHKTFAIPHGGGGPGVGPVAAKAHLAPYLPGHPLDPFGGRDSGAVAAAPHGSASILPISWAYISLLGGSGLREATGSAVLAANYVAKRLKDTFPILYTGPGGFVAHECIVDTRPLKAQYGITVDDVAKRLVDYGFHAPTMSFPVAGTLMVEPTESEDLGELDRFVAALQAIAGEAAAVGAGTWPADNNPLVGAPHTAACLVGEWEHPYSREIAVYPSAATRESKYWPPVRRIDGPYGDRNIQCSCPPLDAYSK